MKIKYPFFLGIVLLNLYGLADAQQLISRSARLKAIVTSTTKNISWYDLQKQRTSVLHGQGWPVEQKGEYIRLPERAKEKIRTAVWSLSEQDAGLSVRFTTNARVIRVCYQVSGGLAFPHMPATGVSGLDLYTVDENGKSLWCGGTYTFNDTIKYNYPNLTSGQPGSEDREYQLFLPLYNHVKWMEIGLPEDARLKWIAQTAESPIVVYGTSIAQGGCASRPGMAWTNILERELRLPFINLGFSGNGRLEKEILNLINEIDAKLYILDCLPNLDSRSAAEIETATVEAVLQIRSLHKTPVLLVEHAGYSDRFVNKDRFESFSRANLASKTAFEQLKKQGVQNIFYLSCEDLNMPMDGMVDGTHPTDYGMRAYADAFEKVIVKILGK